MKSWICLFLVTIATATQAAPRKDQPPKKASHSIVHKVAKGQKVGRSVPASLPAKKAGKTVARHSAPAKPTREAYAGKGAALATAALTATAGTAALAAPAGQQSESATLLAGNSVNTANAVSAMEPTPAQNNALLAPGVAPPRSAWQGLQSSVSEKAHRMADRAHEVADKAHGMVDGAAHAVADRTTDLVVHAMGFLGVPYRRGGNNAETGFDCSGFVRAMFQQTAGALLPRSAREQADATEVIDKKELRPGDLVFFNTMRRAFSHVGIYVGDGKFIHSPRSGSVVRVENMKESYWASRFNGARRVGEMEAAEMQAAITAKRY